jgi:hypothetical protein
METVLLLPAKRLLAFATKSDLGVLLPLQRQLDVRYLFHKSSLKPAGAWLRATASIKLGEVSTRDAPW